MNFGKIKAFAHGVIVAAKGGKAYEEMMNTPAQQPQVVRIEEARTRRQVVQQPEYDDDQYEEEQPDIQQGYQPQYASDDYHRQVYESYGVEPVRSKKVQDGLSYIAEYVGAISLWIYLGYSQAQVFTGFRFPAWDFTILVVGGICFVFELIGLVLLFQAAERAYKKDWSGVVVRLSGFLIVAISGFASQVVLLNSELVRHVLSFPDSALTGLPINQSFVFFWRSILPAVAQVYLVFLVSKTQYDVDKAIENRRKHQEAIHKLEREDAEAEQRKLDNDTLLEMKRVSAEGAKRWAEVLMQGQQNTIQEMTPRYLVQRFQQPQIPERVSPDRDIQKDAVQPTIRKGAFAEIPIQRPSTRPPERHILTEQIGLPQNADNRHQMTTRPSQTKKTGGSTVPIQTVRQQSPMTNKGGMREETGKANTAENVQTPGGNLVNHNGHVQGEKIEGDDYVIEDLGDDRPFGA